MRHLPRYAALSVALYQIESDVDDAPSHHDDRVSPDMDIRSAPDQLYELFPTHMCHPTVYFFRPDYDEDG